jgi:large subunit ribosomal protein L21
VFAVISDRGRQAALRVGDVVACDLQRSWKEGDTVSFDRVLLVAHEGTVRLGQPALEGVRVVGRVLGQMRSEKTVSMRFKRRKNVRRKRGHRQSYTRVEITAIEG